MCIYNAPTSSEPLVEQVAARQQTTNAQPPGSCWPPKCLTLSGYDRAQRTRVHAQTASEHKGTADDDVIYFQYDSSTPLRFSAPE
jgi:hypothetical protein